MEFNWAFKGLKCPLTLTQLTWKIWWAPINVSRWQMGFNWAFKGLKCPLTLILLTWRIWWAPINVSRWQMGFNWTFKGLKCLLTLILLTWRIWWAPNNASRWQMGINSAFKGLIRCYILRSKTYMFRPVVAIIRFCHSTHLRLFYTSIVPLYWVCGSPTHPI